MNDTVTQFFYACAGVLLVTVLFVFTLIHVVRLFRLFRSTGSAPSSASPNSLNYTPRGDRIIVKRAELPETPATGIVVPASQTKALDEGTVVAVGEQIDDLEVGDYVCFLEYAGTKVTIDGEEYLSMRDEEVHGVRQGAQTEPQGARSFDEAKWCCDGDPERMNESRGNRGHAKDCRYHEDNYQPVGYPPAHPSLHEMQVESLFNASRTPEF
jgi:chaperonin GroES